MCHEPTGVRGLRHGRGRPSFSLLLFSGGAVSFYKPAFCGGTVLWIGAIILGETRRFQPGIFVYGIDGNFEDGQVRFDKAVFPLGESALLLTSRVVPSYSTMQNFRLGGESRLDIPRRSSQTYQCPGPSYPPRSILSRSRTRGHAGSTAPTERKVSRQCRTERS